MLAFLVLLAVIGGIVAAEIGEWFGEPAKGPFVVTLLATLTYVGARLFKTARTRMNG